MHWRVRRGFDLWMGSAFGFWRLLRFTRDGATGLVETIDVGPPPPGLPDMRGRKIILDPETGNATRMQGALQGAILTCRFAECGTFSISVNGSASRVALDSLPKRVALRHGQGWRTWRTRWKSSSKGWMPARG